MAKIRNETSARQEQNVLTPCTLSNDVLSVMMKRIKMNTEQSPPLVVGVAAAAMASESSTATNLNSGVSSLTVPSIVSCNQNEAYLDAMVTKVVNESIFHKKQFIVLERELETSSKLADTCLAALKMERDQWEGIKNIVRKKLNRRRNNAQLCVRRSLKGKWIGHRIEYLCMILIC